MKNGFPGWFRKALPPLALFLLVFSSTVLHAAPPVVDDAGFASVFNGQDLKGWTLQAHAVWRVENGDLVGRQDPAEKEDGWLFSEAEWSDFTLELEFKVPEKCNSGIALRMPKEATGSPDVHGYEVQISDLPARKLTGSLLHHIESKTNNLHQANKWNRLAVTCEDDHLVVYLNGLKVVDAKEKGSKKGRIGMQVPKGAEFARQEVRFRNIRAKELKRKQTGAALDYQGRPWQGQPQAIPGPVFCAYYDTGGEGVAYHDTDAENQGSGKLNRADGSYLNEFRKSEGLDISYTKRKNDLESPCNKVTPPLGLLYVGWNEPGEWFKLTVETAAAGTFVADVLYTSQRGGTIGIEVDGTTLHSAFELVSTFDAAETIPWRQWHHWDVARDAFAVTLPKGVSVLTVRIVTNGNLNLATFAFRPKGSERTGPDITAVKTLSPTLANRGESVAAAVRSPAEMLLNGNFADGTNHWVVMESGATGRAEIVAEGPEGKTALRLRVLTIGDKPWRLQIYQTGMRVEQGKAYVLTFWAKSDRAGSIMVNCMQNHAPWDHQTQKQMPVSAEWEPLRYTFVAPWDDDKVRISFTDLGTVPEQVYWFASCSLVPNAEAKTTAALAPPTAAAVTAPSASFVWKGDCSSEAAFVGSKHPTIPGHYEYLPDPKEPARGLVFAGHLTPEFTTTDPEKFHLHPDIYFDRFIPGGITVSFDVKVDNLAPSELGPYGNNAWLNLVTLFDETTVAAGKSFHPSAMVNLVGTSGTYRLQAYSIDAAGAGTFYERIEGGPVFPTGKWVTVRMEVDVKTKQVRVYLDKALASTGAHMGLYANRKMTRATVFNDDITITVGD